MVPLHRGIQHADQGLQRGIGLLHHPAVHDVGPGVRLHPLLRLEDVQAPRGLHVRSLLFLRCCILSF